MVAETDLGEAMSLSATDEVGHIFADAAPRIHPGNVYFEWIRAD